MRNRSVYRHVAISEQFARTAMWKLLHTESKHSILVDIFTSRITKNVTIQPSYSPRSPCCECGPIPPPTPSYSERIFRNHFQNLKVNIQYNSRYSLRGVQVKCTVTIMPCYSERISHNPFQNLTHQKKITTRICNFSPQARSLPVLFFTKKARKL